MLQRVLHRALRFVLLAFVLAACKENSATPPPAGAAANTAADTTSPAPETTEPEVHPLPAFQSHTLSGEAFSSAALIGKRGVLFFFNPAAPEAEPAARALAAVSDLRGAHNFAIVGIATAAPADTARAFVERLKLAFPVLDDSSAALANRFGVRVPALIIATDAEGNIAFASPVVAEGPNPAQIIENIVRERLRLSKDAGELVPVLGTYPPAPDFSAQRLEENQPPLRSEELRGRPFVLIFFLHTCPHCHSALKTLKEELAKIPAEKRPELIGVSLSNHPFAVQSSLKDAGLDFFQVVLDPDSQLRDRFGVLGGVPDLLLIDAEGRITARSSGWRDDRDPPLLRMRLAKLAGTSVPMLLSADGYSGDEFCGVCHESALATWELTSHANAFHTLVKHGEDKNAECVSCHVVGFGEPGGYTLAGNTPYLEDVSCETCHGRGGPHLSPHFVSEGNYEQACLRCHDTKHSLGFEYARFLPRISHAANAHLVDLSLAEKRAFLQKRGQALPRAELPSAQAPFVGSQACQSCHPAEYAIWEKSAHAHAGTTLEAKGADGKADCLRCHTTGYGREGGFPKNAAVAAHADLARVGCESCHGPGGAHVPADAPKRGSILALGDKCDSCVVLELCGRCHDDANDPGFEFEIKEKIELQWHGPRKTKSEAPSSQQSALERAPDWALFGSLERLFQNADARG